MKYSDLENAVINYNDFNNSIGKICIKTNEECAELIKELCKFVLGAEFNTHIIDEMIDVEIMIHQLKISLLLSKGVDFDKYEQHKNNKIFEWLTKNNLFFDKDLLKIVKIKTEEMK